MLLDCVFFTYKENYKKPKKIKKSSFFFSWKMENYKKNYKNNNKFKSTLKAFKSFFFPYSIVYVPVEDK